MEIMIAIGVATIGVLGAIALIPLAGHQAEAGITADRMRRMAASAEQQFSISGYRDPTMWVGWSPDAQLTFLVQNPPQNTVVPGYPGAMLGAAFCIDPRFFAHHFERGNLVNFPQAAFFPYYAPFPNFTSNHPPTRARMWRVGVLPSPTMTVANPMSKLLADEIFTLRDDLSFDRPDDDTLPPQQSFGSMSSSLTSGSSPIAMGADGQWGVAGVDDDNNGVVDDASEAFWYGSDDIGKRRAKGQLSWMATVAPMIRDPLQFSATELSDAYTLSLVIFNRRNQGFPLADAVPTEPSTERLVDVVFDGGGEVRLVAKPGRGSNDLALRDGDWIMLSSYVYTKIPPTLPGTRIVPVFRWYKVLKSEATAEQDTVNFGGRWRRYATLHGPDWLPAQQINPGTGQPFFATEATLLNGVVGVYEKTIRLERGSLWGTRSN